VVNSLRQRSEILKREKREKLRERLSLIGIEPCFYCGGVSRYFFEASGRYCCEEQYLKCSANKKRQGERTFASIVETDEVCSYGCGQKANYQFQNGKYCCSERLQSCPEIRKKNAVTNSIKQKGKGNGMYGKKQSAESKRKNSEGNKRAWADPDSIFNSPEWREKISIASSGENNGNWRGGISKDPYCFEFTKELKDFIKERDGYICQNIYCYSDSSILVVHHINYDKKDCTPENLITLCNSCNGRANRRRRNKLRFYKRIINYGFNQNTLFER
jgi:hypothetical protein